MKLKPLLFAMTVVAISAAQAQTPSGDTSTPPDRHAAHAAVMKACSADIQSLCADKKGREVMMCLHANTDKLSSGCKDALSTLHKGPPPPQ